MVCRKIISSIIFSLLFFNAVAQSATSETKGKLFIMGGGERPPSLMRSLLETAALKDNDYIAVLPMSSEEPDTAYSYFKADLETLCGNAIVNFNFTKERVADKGLLDSLEKAKLIFITGGDQERFMDVVVNTPVGNIIQKAYRNGATIAGTSAGAAVMSKYMITGRELTDTAYHPTFRKIEDKNIELKQGLGLIDNAIIDQHFVTRSRYNRLLSALAAYPKIACIGIDEGTAIIVQRNKVKVSGQSQVIVMKNPDKLTITKSGLIKFSDIRFSIYTDGDEFTLDKSP